MTATLMQTLAWSLLHFLWQGAAIAAFAAALLYVFRKPATRYLLGVSALGLMMLSFAVTFSLLNDRDEPPAAATAAGAPAAVLVPPAGTPAAPQLPWTGEQAAIASAADFAWVARGWLLGVFVLALRIAFGLFIIEQLRRRKLVALPDVLVARLRALQARLGITRRIHFAECSLVNVPAVIGFFRPVVLVPLRALTGLSPEQLDALIAHELGHIKRFDVAVNFVQVVAETLFFFHPAVWWLNGRIRADREDCCDDIAVSAGGSSIRYAKALATIANWRDVPSFAMAATGGPVAARVARLLGVKRDGANTAGVFTAAVILAGALVAGAVSLGLAEPAQAQAAEAVPTPSPAAVSPDTAADGVSPAVAAVPAPAAAPAPHPTVAPRPAVVPRPAPHVRAAPAPAVNPAPPPALTPKPAKPVADETREQSSYLEEIRAELGDVNVDDLIALKSQGVTAKYIRQLRSRGIQASADQLVAMKVHGVTPEYVKQVRDLGFTADTDEIIAFKTQDISPEFVRQVRAMGFDAKADEILAMKVHGINAGYVQQMRDAGLEFDSDELIGLRVQDVTPEYVRQMRDVGLKFDTDALIGLKVQGITPEYVTQMRASGLDADTDEIIAMKVHDVTPGYRRALESAGFKLSVDQLVTAKVMDITPEFIRKVNEHGFKNLDIDQLIALKHANVL